MKNKFNWEPILWNLKEHGENSEVWFLQISDNLIFPLTLRIIHPLDEFENKFYLTLNGIVPNGFQTSYSSLDEAKTTAYHMLEKTMLQIEKMIFDYKEKEQFLVFTQ